MSYREYLQRDLELQGQIAHYRSDSEQKKSEIALNEKEIVNLEFQRCELRKQYAESEYPEEAA